jgi:hypothetical protein
MLNTILLVPVIARAMFVCTATMTGEKLWYSIVAIYNSIVFIGKAMFCKIVFITAFIVTRVAFIRSTYFLQHFG